MGNGYRCASGDPRDWSLRLGRIAGILAGIGYLFLLFYTLIATDSVYDRGRVITCAVIGVVASIAAVVVACAVKGLARGIVLTGIGILLVLLPSLVPARGQYLQGLYVLGGGEAGFMTFGLVLLLLMLGGMHARRVDAGSGLIRWVLCGTAGVGVILQAVYGLVLLSGNTGWSRETTRSLSVGGPVAITTFIWITLAVWGILSLGLVSALREVSVEKIAQAGLVLAKVLMWSIVGLVLLAFGLMLTGQVNVAHMVPGLVFAVVTGLLPFIAGAYLCAGSFSATLLLSGPLLAKMGEGKRGSGLPRATALQEARPAAESGVGSVEGEQRRPVGSGPELSTDGPRPTDPSETLKTLKRLRDEGLITEKDFEAKKRQVLEQM